MVKKRKSAGESRPKRSRTIPLPGLGGRIREARLEAAKRDRELERPARAARRLGEGAVTYGRWEDDKREPPASALLRIAALYGVDAGELTFGPPEGRAAMLGAVEAVRMRPVLEDAAEDAAAASRRAGGRGDRTRGGRGNTPPAS